MRKKCDVDPALPYLEKLREETMRRAWGEREPEERRRIVAAAIIFGRQFDRQAGSISDASEREAQRLLMAVINASIQEFAEREGVTEEVATNFLSEVSTRDLVLEFNEVLEAWADNPGSNLDELLQQAVDNRSEKARRADHEMPY